jgi:hypothetical protein
VEVALRPQLNGPRLRSWRLSRVVWALTTVLLMVFGSTLGLPNIATYTYDVPPAARFDAHSTVVVGAQSQQANGSGEPSAARRAAARGASTSSSVSFVATNTASLADEGFISRSSVRFSQNSVSPNFSAGGSIDDLAAGLRNGSVAPGDVPQIRIFESNGQWMTLDNRRLVAFQQAVVDVPYRLATAEEIAAQTWKVTTTNGGTSITIRGGGGSWPR